jgi:anti-sigma B factor antagonist
MQVDIRDDGSIVFIEPVGDIDGKTAPEVHDKVFKLLLPQARIALNLERVAFMSSAGLREMLLIYREAKAKDAKVVLAGVNDDIRSSIVTRHRDSTPQRPELSPPCGPRFPT